MNKILEIKLLIISILFNIFLSSGQEVHFTVLKTPSDWDIALNLAKANGKKLFLDIYATWCGPCKMMDTQVYTDSSVAEYFNKNFINVKVDGESEFGTVLVSQYKLTAYPSMYFINGNKDIIFTAVGYKEPAALNALAEQVVKNGERFLALSSKFNHSQLDPDERKEFLDLLLSFGHQDLYQQVVAETLNSFTEEEVLNPANKTIVFHGGGELDSKSVGIVIKNASIFRTAWGVEDFNKYLAEVFNISIQKAISNRDEAKMERIADVFIPVYLMDSPDRIIPSQLITRKIYFAETGNWDKYIQSVEDYINKYGNGRPKFLYNEAYYIVENKITNDKMLAKALEWINRELVIQPGFESYFLGTIINAYRKDLTQANIWIAKAEPLAASQEDKSSVVQLKAYLEKLKTGHGARE